MASIGISGDDPDGLMSKYLDKSTVELSNIVDDGYRPGQKKQSCKAHIKVTISGNAASLPWRK